MQSGNNDLIKKRQGFASMTACVDWNLHIQQLSCYTILIITYHVPIKAKASVKVYTQAAMDLVQHHKCTCFEDPLNFPPVHHCKVEVVHLILCSSVVWWILYILRWGVALLTQYSLSFHNSSVTWSSTSVDEMHTQWDSKNDQKWTKNWTKNEPNIDVSTGTITASASAAIFEISAIRVWWTRQSNAPITIFTFSTTTTFRKTTVSIRPTEFSDATWSIHANIVAASLFVSAIRNRWTG